MTSEAEQCVHKVPKDTQKHNRRSLFFVSLGSGYCCCCCCCCSCSPCRRRATAIVRKSRRCTRCWQRTALFHAFFINFLILTSSVRLCAAAAATAAKKLMIQRPQWVFSLHLALCLLQIANSHHTDDLPFKERCSTDRRRRRCC